MNTNTTQGAWMRRLTALVLSLSTTGLAGCLIQQPNPDINRVQKPYLPKSQLADGHSWYLRRTIVDAPPQSWDAIGSGDWPVAERVRFEVRETALVLYRDYEIVPGSDTAEQPGSDYRGSWVASFPIVEHFDVRRGYNPLTGEQTNTIEKNVERPWFQREYMVVNWGAPTVEWGGQNPNPAYYVQEHEVTHPDRARFSNDYMEFTLRQSADPYLISCWGGLDWGTVPDCGAGTVDTRWSLHRVDEQADFEPTPFPDSVQLVDDAGKSVKDTQGRLVRVPIFDKFGFFRLERLTYDRDRGVTDSGRIMRAFKFNLWERSFGADGQAIPFAERTPKPVIYYMNADMPEDEWGSNNDYLAGLTMKQANTEIGNEYNLVFREIVETLQARPLDPNFKMFEVKENDCNFNKVTQFVNDNGLQDSLGFLGGVDGFRTKHDEVGTACRAEPYGRTCSSLRQKWSFTLRQACTAVESATENNADDQPKFSWQRIGDVRYSFVHLTSHLQSVGWLGLGMLAADPITGEIRNAFAYVDGPGTDYSAMQAVDMVEAMNDQTEFSDLLFGTDIAAYTAMQNQKVGAKLRGQPSANEIANIERKFRGLGRTQDELLREGEAVLPGAMAKLSRLAGTPLERTLLNQDDLMLAANSPLASNTDVTEQMLDKVSPVRGGFLKMTEAYEKRVQKAMGGKEGPCHYLREFMDEALIGMALQLRDRPRVEKWAYLRFMIYKTVMLHEVGHTLGLRHNFQGTYDSLNYSDNFFRKLEVYTTVSTTSGERESISLEDAYTIAQAGISQGGTDAASFTKDREMLDNCLFQVEASATRFVEECVANDTSTSTEVQKTRNCTDQLPAARAAGQLLQVDAMQCIRAEEGKSSSVMDYHGKLSGRFEGLGYYDKAALKFGYGQIVEEFEPAALKTITAESAASSIRQWQGVNDYKRIIDDLANGRQALTRRVNRYKPWGLTQTRHVPQALEVPYGFCSDERAYTGGGTDVCRLRDHGGNHREQMEHDILRYKQYYFFSQFARNRLTWDIGGAIQGNRGIFDNILRTFQYMYFYRASSPDFFNTDIGRDFLKASTAGLDLYAEVLAQPEQGTFVSPTGTWGFTRDSRVRGRWMRYDTQEFLDLAPDQLDVSGGAMGSKVAVPTYYYGTCDWGDTSDVQCATGSQYPGFVCNNDLCGINIPLGDGRPSFLNYTNDYEDWFFTYVGNYFDKQSLIVNLVRSQAYFPTLSEEGGAGSNNPNVRLLNIGLASLFGDSIRGLLHGLITDRVRDYSSIYRPGVGYITRSFQELDPATRNLQPNDVIVVPRRITNLPYLTLLYAMAFQSSLDDGVLDFVNVAQIGVRGEEDDIGGWDNLPATEKIEWTHPTSGITYRAAKVSQFPIGYEIVAGAKRMGDRYLAYKECTDNPAKADGICACTYVGKYNQIDKNLDGIITGTGSGQATDECVLTNPENGLRPCESRVEPCAGPDRVDGRDRAFERMEAEVERIENIRGFYQSFAGSWRL